jgi:hypothetical protein
MSNKTKRAVAVALLAAMIAVVASFRTYSVISGGGGDVLWNDNEAYVFVEDIQRGYRFRYLTLPVEILGEYFYWVPNPDAQQVHCVVLHVTSTSGIDRRVIDVGTDTALCPNFFTPAGEEIYAWCPGVVCKWTGTDFKPVTDAEAHSIGGLEGLAPREFAHVDGWSKHALGSEAAGSKFTIKVDGKFELLETHHPLDKYGLSSISVEIIHPGQDHPEKIWNVDDSHREVSRAEYVRLFGHS